MSELKHKPKTPLPWAYDPMGVTYEVDLVYSFHAANQYPKLIEALRMAKIYSSACPPGWYLDHNATIDDALAEAGED